MDHPGSGAVNLKFEVFDFDSKSAKLKNHDFLARLEVSLDAILKSPGMHYVTVMSSGPSRGGHFIVTAERLGGAGGGHHHHHGGGGAAGRHQQAVVAQPTTI